MKIVVDSGALYSKEEGKELDIDILNLSVTINQKTYVEYEEIKPGAFIDLIKEGYMPTSSQPTIGETMNVFSKYPDVEILAITMSDGLSGTYQSTLMAAENMEGQTIEVFNTETLCGPERYLVNEAIKLKNEGKSLAEIINHLKELSKRSLSFLIPEDFKYLQKGGRLSPMAAKLGGLLKVIPILTLNNETQKLEKYAIKKTEKGAIKTIIKAFEELKLTAPTISITHAGVVGKATFFKELIEEAMPQAKIEILELSPAFITHGGPGCVAIQIIG